MTLRNEMIPATFNTNSPASQEAIQRVETELGRELPSEYKEFLGLTNGGEGFIGESYLMMYRVEELVEMNQGYDVEQYAPGLFLFGSDGGGEGLAYDLRSEANMIVSVPYLGMEWNLAIPMGGNFSEFFEKLAAGDAFE